MAPPRVPRFVITPSLKKKGMLTLADRIRSADHLAGVIDTVADAVTRAEGAEVDHLAAAVKKGAIRTVGQGRITGDLTGSVNAPGLTIFAPEGADIDQLPATIRVAGSVISGQEGALEAPPIWPLALMDKLDAVVAAIIGAEGAQVSDGVSLGHSAGRSRPRTAAKMRICRA
mgnify:CR=1 FL=1